MRRYLAVLRDSLTEMADQKLFYATVIVLVMTALLIAGTRLVRMTPEEQALHWGGVVAQILEHADADVADEGSTPTECRFRVTLPAGQGAPPSGDLLAYQFERRLDPNPEDEIPALVYLEPRFDIRSDGGAWTVHGSFTVPDESQMPTVKEFRLLFGLVHMYTPSVPPTPYICHLALWGILSWAVRFGGIPLMLIGTGAFIPNLMKRGTIDLVLSRPVDRLGVLLTRYVGGFFYVGGVAGAVLLPAWLASASQTGITSPRPLAAIPVLMASFAILYSVSLLFGVLTRSTIVSILASLAAWVLGFTADLLREPIRTWEGLGRPWKIASDVFYFLMPKSSAVNQFFEWALAPESGDPHAASSVVRESWWYLGGSSLFFVAVVVGLACLVFARRDH